MLILSVIFSSVALLNVDESIIAEIVKIENADDEVGYLLPIKIY